MKFISTLTLIFTTLFANAQTNQLRLNPNIALPKDSIESKNLTTSLNDFLFSAQKPNKENKFVFEDEKIETFIQLDEINGIEKSGKYKDDFFYKPYLTNVVLLKDKNYLIQVSYIGTNENVAILRASFEFIAHKSNDSFMFSSPLLRNTKNWKVEKVANNIFHYQNSINKEKIKEFNKLTSSFDLKLKATNKIIDYYCTDNIIEMQKLIGVDYKSDYNGRTESVWSSSFGDRKLIVLGNNNSTFNDFDSHDLFHDRLSLVIPRSKVNKPVDEGCAYLYGGSWGMSWTEIFKAFKEQIASNKNTNWTEIKETPIYFKTGNYPNSADYIVNALLVKKIEKEKGFEGVWELLNVGAFEKGNEKYYQTLEKLTGITKANYNEKIWEIVNNEK
ncbi:MAG: hypothetical protein K9J37_07860 [Saprospiraceae bacterium]|nr:hypothetical protein [Saprospiraceae bacterium]MCF8249813.1 hypothetical protein [Saprospiraceae bacterium]MCF8313436.1 hypothetical protein [Saprospiraceae bacterium]MCF8442149.1 hypothetical protein [Saprospiraceae bacterium]